ncbi:hypothetical protein [Pseudoalteromonas sp. GB56]
MTKLLAFKMGICALCATLSTTTFANVVIYKCQTSEGTVFSQFPCDNNAQELEVKHSNPNLKAPKEDFSKPLTQLEKERKRESIELQIRSTKHQVVVLKRERSARTLEQEQRLERLMSDEERKALKVEVKENIKNIDKRYTQRIKESESSLASLQKSLEKFQ